MTGIDHRGVLRVLGHVYDAVEDDSGWPTAIAALRELMNASTACLARLGPDIQPDDAISTIDPAFTESFIVDFAEGTELGTAVAGIPVGTVFCDQRILGEHGLRRTRLWNDWMAPQDMYGSLSCRLLATESSYWYLDVQRGRRQPEFATADKEMLQTLLPHLQRAVAMARRRHLARAVFGGCTTTDALLVGWSMTPLSPPTHLAPEMLDDVLANPALRNRVQAACRSPDLAPASEVVSLCDASYVVSVSPVSRAVGSEAGALIVLRPVETGVPPQFGEIVARLFGMTRKEAQLAGLLAAGLSLHHAATRLGVSLGTARNYLLRLFRKTCTHRQSQLIAVLKSVPVPKS